MGIMRIAEVDPTKLELIKELKAGESFEMEIQTDRGNKAKIRITHR